MQRIEVIRGDITKLNVDAIVNAANHFMLGGGGVDGAIHRAAGPKLLEECRAFLCVDGIRCKTGYALVTKGYQLPAKWVIHTVGPVWYGGQDNEEQLLADCYANSLLCAVSVGAETIAFPSISTGAYGFPITRAAGIAHATVRGFLDGTAAIKQVTFCCFDSDDFEVHGKIRQCPA